MADVKVRVNRPGRAKNKKRRGDGGPKGTRANAKILLKEEPAVEPIPDDRVEVVGELGEPRLHGPRAGACTLYRAIFVEQAQKLSNLGATDAEIADFFGVSVKTIGSWRSFYAEFDAALRSGKDAFDDRIERSLAMRAAGYTYDAVKIFCAEGRVTEVPYREHVPPDVTACIFWLKNRRPDRWREVSHKHHTGNVAVTISQEENMY